MINILLDKSLRNKQKAIYRILNVFFVRSFIEFYAAGGSSYKYKQPKYPSVDEGVKKLGYIYTIEYYLAIKKKKGNLTFCDGMGGPRGFYTK